VPRGAAGWAVAAGLREGRHRSNTFHQFESLVKKSFEQPGQRSTWECSPLAVATDRLLPVRQGEFAIARANDAQDVLATENVWTCSAFVGLDNVNHVAFLCHLDWPPTRASVGRLLEAISSEVGDASQFKVYLVTGIWRGWTWILPILIAAFGYIFQPSDWPWILGFAAFVMGFLSFARVGLWLQLWRLNAFKSCPKIIACSSKTLGMRLSGVSIDATAGKLLPTRSYWSRREFERYKWRDSRELGEWTEAEDSVKQRQERDREQTAC
jgi:hypothetical protein